MKNVEGNREAIIFTPLVLLRVMLKTNYGDRFYTMNVDKSRTSLSRIVTEMSKLIQIFVFNMLFRNSKWMQFDQSLMRWI